MVDRGVVVHGGVRLAVLAIAILLPATAAAQLTTTEKADIGFTALQARLGAAMPLGIGVSATIVEAPIATGEYRVDTADAQLTGKTYSFPSGGNTGASWHATTVGKYLFGTQSLAPRVGATVDGSTIANYEVNNWLGSGFLRTGTPGSLPAVETRKLVSQSWVGSAGSTATDTEILDRADYAVQRDGTIATYGLNNGSGTAIPSLMASTYNGIVVGLSDGNHSRGTTTIDGSGRQKPDIVSPAVYTSWATPTVSSAAALLVQTATGGLANGRQPQAVKALLMAGADKAGPNLPGTWSWSHSSSQPLDAVYGAGQLNVEKAYDILVAGEFAASGSSTALPTAWDYGTASAATAQRYYFDIGVDLAGGDLTASLNWMRSMSATDQPGPGTNYVFSGTLANLDLRLYAASGFTPGSLIAQSTSTLDNTELIWARGLSAGRYVLDVTSNTNSINYGLAWTVIVPEPGTVALAVAAVATVGVLRASRRRTTAPGPRRPG